MTMHLSAEQLLDVRDGEASAEALEHARSCSECSAEVDSLRSMAESLRALPALGPESDQWPQIRREVIADRRRGRTAAAAAILALAASVAALLLVPPTTDQQPGPRIEARPQVATVDELMEESRELEEMLRAFAPRGRVMDAWEASAASNLEYEIGLIDGRLAGPQAVDLSPVESTRLWKERVDLMNELVRVRGARPTYVGL